MDERKGESASQEPINRHRGSRQAEGQDLDEVNEPQAAFRRIEMGSVKNGRGQLERSLS